MSDKLDEAVAFFKREATYDRLFYLFKQKYKSLNRIGGTIKLTDFTTVELDTLARFFGVSVAEIQAKPTLSLNAFEQQLTKTRFHNVTLKPLLDAYFEKNIRSHKEQQAHENAKVIDLFKDIRIQYPVLTEWVTHVLTYPSDGRWVWRLAAQQPEAFLRDAQALADGLSAMPKDTERLPMFSQRITGDPHAFDSHQNLGKLFLYVLVFKRTLPEEDILIPSDTEGINELLNDYHLYRDDLLNFVTISGLLAERKTGKDALFLAAVNEQAVQILPLRELLKLTRVYPATGNQVFIVENSGVCSVLLDHVPNAPLICTNGQFTLTSLLLLDHLAQSGCTLHYASDFDPEGLGMAQRLLKRYPDHIKLWHMDASAYQASNPVKPLSKERLKKLDRINHEALCEVVDLMFSKRQSGYQEALVAEMISDLSSLTKYGDIKSHEDQTKQ